jgi:thiol:disulfide interchange protein DsbD
MDHVKHFFAAILIAGGIFIMGPVLPGWIAMLLWGIFFVVLSVFAGLLKPTTEGKIKEKIVKLAVVLILLGGIFLLVKSLNDRYFAPPQDTTVSLETGWLTPAESGTN